MTAMAGGNPEFVQMLAERVPALAGVEAPVLERLLDGARIVRLDRGRFVFHAGDACEAFLLLLGGAVRVQLTSSGGREVTLYRISPGGSCILTTSCLLSDGRYPAEAVAEAETEALAIPSPGFQWALEHSRQFRSFVFDSFSQRLSHVIQRIEELAFTSIDARLAKVLLELDQKGIDEITHQALAVEIGTAREVISRHLKRFEAARLVSLERGKVSLRDRQRMEKLAAGHVGD